MKVCVSQLFERVTVLLSPRQPTFGVVVEGGAEAAVHDVGQYMEETPTGGTVAKLDFKNAFTTCTMDVSIY